jgi:hypothetical protein
MFFDRILFIEGFRAEHPSNNAQQLAPNVLARSPPEHVQLTVFCPSNLVSSNASGPESLH